MGWTSGFSGNNGSVVRKAYETSYNTSVIDLKLNQPAHEIMVLIT